MVGYVEIVGLVLCAALAGVCTFSDLKFGLVRNNVLFGFLLVAVVYGLLYYGFAAPYLRGVFLGNVAAVSLLSFVLYRFGAFAGGDCKMAIVLACLYPAACCVQLWGVGATMVLAVVLSFAIGYLWLFLYSLVRVVRAGFSVDFIPLKEAFSRFLRSYAAVLSYVAFIGGVLSLFGMSGSFAGALLQIVSCLAAAFAVGRFPILRRFVVFVPFGVTALAVAFLLGVVPIAFRPEMFLLALILIVGQVITGSAVYERVHVSDLAKGMILTTVSSLVMQSSKVKGLPGVSTEGIESRLTEEEVASVKRWAKITHTDTLTVVRKLPFAVFISLGYLSYFGLWGLGAWI